jgi:hypothetical protein
LKTLQQQHPSATITKSISFFKVKGSISGGTIESMKSVAQIPPKERLRSEWQLVNRTSMVFSGFAGPRGQSSILMFRL